MAFNPPSQPFQEQQPANQPTNIVTALGNAFKTQTGDPMSGEQIAQLLIDNMDKLGKLAKQGKLTQVQITQLLSYANKHKATQAAPTAEAAGAPSSASDTISAQVDLVAHALANAHITAGPPNGNKGTLAATAAGSSAAATATTTPATAAFKTANPGPFPAASPAHDGYPISQTPAAIQHGSVPAQSQVMTALENVFRTPTGEPMSGAQIAQLLVENMDKLGELARQGKLTLEQIIQLKKYADRHKATQAAPAAPAASSSTASTQGTPMAPAAGSSAAAAAALATPPAATFKTQQLTSSA